MADQMAEQAELVIHCAPVHRLACLNLVDFRSAKESSDPIGASQNLFVATMCDQAQPSVMKELRDAGWMVTSAQTGEGIAELRLALAQRTNRHQLLDGSCVPALRLAVPTQSSEWFNRCEQHL